MVTDTSISLLELNVFWVLGLTADAQQYYDYDYYYYCYLILIFDSRASFSLALARIYISFCMAMVES
jgi:hypothetical protein